VSNPYLIEGPALISFSGGRTSAYMLRMILDAHGGTLPDDVHVCFANTGKEREETLRFVHECATRWGVRVRWLEWRPAAPKPPKGTKRRTSTEVAASRFEEVGFNSADREGRWFAELIRRKRYLPNTDMRYCTEEMKVLTMRRFMVAQGYAHWTNAVGLRWDEMHRVFKQMARNEAGGQPYTSVLPMARQATQVRKRDIMQFWFGKDRLDLSLRADSLPQGFDLGLDDHEGNCDLCFLKGRSKKSRIIRDQPSLAVWWDRMEKTATTSKGAGQARFNKDESIAQLVAATANSPRLDLEDGDAEEFDAECGLWCAGEAA
jgi:3'-phosphoadenosine 5'-phosphosulfate sulfotransferase (PAPS reductase)/FAD synthetase